MYKYVIIDDEKLIRQGTVKKLSELKDIASCAGEAGNGKDGIELIEEIRPDIVILDMQMPVMDGTQLLAYLAERYPDTPLIVISGYKDFDYVKHAIDAQAVDYILKPFSKDSIQKALLHAISKLESKSSLENQLISSELQRETAYYEYDLQVIRNLIIGYQKDPGNISSKKLSYINHTYNL
jgi:two-component system response regulator YesN